jgi:hypothetical protein
MVASRWANSGLAGVGLIKQQIWYELSAPDGGHYINPACETIVTLPTLLGDTSLLYKSELAP